ncbi:MAG: UbiA-like polyprenyltransferase [Planctomycetota bacterium]
MASDVRKVLSMIKFSHSIFALPFALQAAWLAAGGMPHWPVLAGVVVCAVAARTAAMAFNRLVDRDIDADNPRTAGRELPSGQLSVPFVTAVVVLSSAVFVGVAYWLAPIAGHLSWPILAVLLGYSHMKRLHFSAHLVLGLCLALAPLAAWVAVRGSLHGVLGPVLLLALVVWTWVAGFDVIYACQDAQFDEQAGLHSIPARFGVARALWISRGLHVFTAGALVAFAIAAHLSWIYWIAVGLTAALLVFEQSLVRADDLSRVNVAFFTLNGWIGVLLFAGLVLDMGLLQGRWMA